MRSPPQSFPRSTKHERGFVLLLVMVTLVVLSAVVMSQYDVASSTNLAGIRGNQEARARSAAEFCIKAGEAYLEGHLKLGGNVDFDGVLDPDGNPGSADNFVPPSPLATATTYAGVDDEFHRFGVVPVPTGGACLLRFDDNSDDHRDPTGLWGLYPDRTDNNTPNPITDDTHREGPDYVNGDGLGSTVFGRDNVYRDRDLSVIITAVGVFPANGAAADYYKNATSRVTLRKLYARAAAGQPAIYSGGTIDVSNNAALCGGGILGNEITLGGGCVCGAIMTDQWPAGDPQPPLCTSDECSGTCSPASFDIANDPPFPDLPGPEADQKWIQPYPTDDDGDVPVDLYDGSNAVAPSVSFLDNRVLGTFGNNSTVALGELKDGGNPGFCAFYFRAKNATNPSTGALYVSDPNGRGFASVGGAPANKPEGRIYVWDANEDFSGVGGPSPFTHDGITVIDADGAGGVPDTAVIGDFKQDCSATYDPIPRPCNWRQTGANTYEAACYAGESPCWKPVTISTVPANELQDNHGWKIDSDAALDALQGDLTLQGLCGAASCDDTAGLCDGTIATFATSAGDYWQTANAEGNAFDNRFFPTPSFLFFENKTATAGNDLRLNNHVAADWDYGPLQVTMSSNTGVVTDHAANKPGAFCGARCDCSAAADETTFVCKAAEDPNDANSPNINIPDADNLQSCYVIQAQQTCKISDTSDHLAVLFGGVACKYWNAYSKDPCMNGPLYVYGTTDQLCANPSDYGVFCAQNSANGAAKLTPYNGNIYLNGSMMNKNNGEYVGNIFALGDVTFKNNMNLDGSITAVGDITLQNNGTINATGGADAYNGASYFMESAW